MLSGVLFWLGVILNLKGCKNYEPLQADNFNNVKIDTLNVFPFNDPDLRQFIIDHDLYDDLIDAFFIDSINEGKYENRQGF